MSDEKKSQELTEAEERRERIFTMRIAGASLDQIAKKEGISRTNVSRLLNTVLSQPTPTVAEQRALENARLDVIQAPMLKAAREGNPRAVQAYLRISERRSRLNGLDAPHQIAVSANIRVEMEKQLQELEALIVDSTPSREIAQRTAREIEARVAEDTDENRYEEDE